MTDMTAYFDYNATAPVKPGVAAAIADALAVGGNPSSVHRNGRLAHAVIEGARDQVAGLVGAASQDVIFTSGGSEANNFALHALVTAGRRLIVSAIEHPSVLAAADRLGATRLAVNADGVVDLAELERLLAADARPALVSIMLANNETGVIQPVAEAAGIAHKYNALLHVDAVQAAGRLAIDIKELGVDLMSLSAHKLGGAMGAGALIVTPHVGKITGLMQGGGQERGLRPGTENVPGIVGFGVAAELAAEDLAGADEIKAMRDDIEAHLTKAGGCVIAGGIARLNNTTCITMPGVASETQVMALDLAGVAVSAGAACSSGKVVRSHVLSEMGLAPDEADSAIRISLGWQTSASDIERLKVAWTEIHGRLGGDKIHGRLGGDRKTARPAA